MHLPPTHLLCLWFCSTTKQCQFIVLNADTPHPAALQMRGRPSEGGLAREEGTLCSGQHACLLARLLARSHVWLLVAGFELHWLSSRKAKGTF